jgi:hypothetical protein
VTRAGFEAGLGNGVRKLLRHAGKVAARNFEICEELFEPAYLVDSCLCWHAADSPFDIKILLDGVSHRSSRVIT